MTRSRLNSETHEETQKSILKNAKLPMDSAAVIEPSTSEEKSKENGDEQSTLHAYEKNRQTEHHLRPHGGSVAMIERQMSKSQAPTATVMPTPTSTERKFTDSFYWMSHLHKKVGLSHIILLLVLAAYTTLGAVVFYYLETPNERLVVAERKVILDNRIEQLAEYLSEMAENKTAEELALDVKARYQWSIVSIDRLYPLKIEELQMDVGSSFFLRRMNVYTTNRLRSIAPETRAGQWFVIIYGFIFVPVTLVVVRDLGQWLLLVITRFYARMLLKYRYYRMFHF
ncbi:hypothetical protein COOONC_05641 [Cooperia oncophora]